jgi:ActR/RegA family two-component response regulator
MATLATLTTDATGAAGCNRTVLVIEDGRRLSRIVGYMCDYLGLRMQRVTTDADLAPLLRRCAPLAVVCALEGSGQDGYHVMKMVAAYDRALSMLLVTGSDPAMIGAAEAVEDAYGLAGVRALQDEPGLGDIVEFLLSADRVGQGHPRSEPQSALAA